MLKVVKKKVGTHSQFISRTLCIIRVIAMARQRSPEPPTPVCDLILLRLLLIDKTAAAEHNSAHVSGASSSLLFVAWDSISIPASFLKHSGSRSGILRRSAYP
jgi:hypothetical protein